jgi:hypothetical protein
MISVKKFVIWLIPVSLFLGWTLSFVKWGDHTGAHGLYGRGIPFPSVLWDNPPQNGGRFVDYPVPLAFILNPLVIYAVFFLAFLIVWTIGKALPKHSSRTPSVK